MRNLWESSKDFVKNNIQNRNNGKCIGLEMFWIIAAVVTALLIFFTQFKKPNNKTQETKNDRSIEIQEQSAQIPAQKEGKSEEINLKNEVKVETAVPKLEDVKEKLAEIPKYSLPSITILFGTQKGTAERFANELKKQADNQGYPTVKVQDIENYDFDGISSEEILVIIAATYIEGRLVIHFILKFWKHILTVFVNLFMRF